jgi:hypothetical protein
MPELFSLKSLGCFYEDSSDQTKSGKTVNCIIHLGPSSVTKAVEYQKWMKKFGATQHIMAGHEMYDSVTFVFFSCLKRIFNIEFFNFSLNFIDNVS